MTSNRPYLIRAFYEWLVDNEQTPHLLVDATNEAAVVPQEFVENGQITLNVGLNAVRDLNLGNDYISFNARFGGHPMDVYVPPQAVMGIYSRESGEGMLFPENDVEPAPDDPTPEPPRPEKRERPSLKVVK
jgi:stringent starvation protein B